VNDYELQRLLDEMTLEEKVNQLLQLAPAFYEGANSAGQITGPLEGMGITEETVRQTGSVLGLGGAEEAIAIQEAHLKHNRLNIPLLTMADVIHGYRTIFPVPLALGCSWDLDLAERSAAIAAKESAVAGIHVTFSPMADLTRDPRWGRVMESTGEDPWLNSRVHKTFCGIWRCRGRKGLQHRRYVGMDALRVLHAVLPGRARRRLRDGHDGV
jgi:beta-glucosidase